MNKFIPHNFDKGNRNVTDWQKREGSRQVSTTIPNSIWNDARQHNLSWNECLIFGIQFRLAERDLSEFPNNILTEKIEKMAKTIQELYEKIDKLENRELEPKEEEEIDEILNAKSPEEIKEVGANNYEKTE